MNVDVLKGVRELIKASQSVYLEMDVSQEKDKGFVFTLS
jgi:hypothetical protein